MTGTSTRHGARQRGPGLVKGAGAAGGEYTPKQQAERPWGQ